MNKFFPSPIVGRKYFIKNKQIIITEFKDNLVTYIEKNGVSHGPYDSNEWNSLNVQEDQRDDSKKNHNNTTSSFIFEYDNTKGVFSVKKEGKQIVKQWQIKGAAGKNGASAFDLWLAKQDPNLSANIDDFFQFLKGKNGENGNIGASAYNIWKNQGNVGSENDFIRSLQGVNGKNGDNGKSAYDLWIDAGNIGSIEDFMKSLKGADGKSGKDGLDGTSAYQIWLNEGNIGDEEDFLKWIQDERKGEKGDTGDIFRPHYDERGYLYFRNEDGEKTIPERVKGEKGNPGPTGKPGKSAYEIWKEHYGGGTESEFLESLKGRDGFIPPPPKYGYKDVTDFQLPEIKVNPRLISSSGELTDTRTPEQILEEQIVEIKEIREQGKKKRYDWFREFTWWCAGADKEILRMCPADHAKNTGIGTVILFTALMASFSGFIAIQLIFEELWIQVLFAIFWGFLIFFLDRFITNTMYSDGKVSISKQELFNGLPRIIIAIFLGIVISAPLELKIFEREIDKQLFDNNQVEKGNFIESNKEYQNIIEQLKIEEINLKSVRTRYDSILSDLACQKPIVKIISTNKRITTENGEILQPIQYTKVIKSQNQINQDIRSQKDDKTEEIKEISSRVIKLELERDSIVSNAIKEFELIKPGLLKRLNTLHDLAQKDYSPWFTSKDIQIESNASQTTSKEGNFWDSILHSWWYFLFLTPIGLIMLLLILIDISPVFYKMMLADGLYDNYLLREKALDKYRARINLLKICDGLDDSQLKKVTPFLFGKEYKKITKSTKDYQDSVFGKKNPDFMSEELQKKNKKLFDEVLDMKTRIVLATYRRWYKTQHDAIIGDPVDDKNAGLDPFETSENIHSKEQVLID